VEVEEEMVVITEDVGNRNVGVETVEIIISYNVFELY
jgi:hypothetical protein